MGGIEKAGDQRLREMVEHLPAAAVHRDRDHLFLNRAAERLTGYHKDELSTLDQWFHLLHRGGNVQARAEYEGDRTSGFFARRTLAIHRKDGSERAVELNRYGQETGEVWLLHDVTERQIAETALRNSEAKLRDLAIRLVQAQEEERKRLARDLHDDFGQRMAAILMELSWLGEGIDPGPLRDSLAGVAERLSVLAQDLQQVSRALHSAVLDKIGLAAAIRSECAALRGRSGVEFSFDADPLPGPPREAVSLALFRVFQEAVQNAIKHSGTDGIAVTLQCDGSALTLRVRDFGRGFDPSGGDAHAGLGLRSMQERVRALGGRLGITSAPGEGTVVEAAVPYNGGGE